jgi:hypothetical protein
MDSTAILVVCAVVATLALVGIAVAAIRTLIQVRATAAEAEAFLRRTEPLTVELQATLREVRAVTDKLSSTVGHAERLAASFEGVGSKAARASHVVLGGLGGPIGRALALWNGVKTGLHVFSQLRSRNDHERDPEEEVHPNDRKRTYQPVGD